MQIIKDRQLIEDTQCYVADEENLPTGDISVSMARWLLEKEKLLHHQGKVGVRIHSHDEMNKIAADLPLIPLLELNFPVFTDGRLFSIAKLLRTRFAYQGELRAVGQFAEDQVGYLARVGVNAFQMENPAKLSQALASLDDFSASYQS